MYLEYTCADISEAKWKSLMKGKRNMSYRWLVNKIKKEMPELFLELSLNLFNPWWKECYRTKTHFILTSSAIEYFFRK